MNNPEDKYRQKEVMARFMERSIRQFLIGDECDMEWYFDSKYMAEMMKEQLPHVELRRRPFDKVIRRVIIPSKNNGIG